MFDCVPGPVTIRNYSVFVFAKLTSQRKIYMFVKGKNLVVCDVPTFGFICFSLNRFAQFRVDGLKI